MWCSALAAALSDALARFSFDLVELVFAYRFKVNSPTLFGLIQCFCLLRCLQAYVSGALIKAAQEDDVIQIEECLDNGAPVDESDEYGTTAVMICSGKNCPRGVQLLVDKKASLDLKTAFYLDSDHRDRTCLMLAASGGLKNVCKILIKAGADRSIATASPGLASDMARKYGHASLADLH